MKIKRKDGLFWVASAIVFGVMVLLLMWEKSGENKLMVIAIVSVLVAFVTIVWKGIAWRKNRITGFQRDDEFTKLALLHAGYQAYLYSMSLWLVLFVLKIYFTKTELVGIGILGSALFFGICLWYYRRNGVTSAE